MKNIANKPVVWRIGGFLLCLLIIWLPFASPIYLLLNNDPNLTTILTMGLLFIIFIILQKFWGYYVYQQPKIFQQYGLKKSTNFFLELIWGIAIGYCFCKLLYLIQYFLGWVILKPVQSNAITLVTEGLISALGIALAEELVFRGWILTELQKDYSENNALLIDSGIFAIAHFLKPLSEIIRTFVTFPALFILGLTLAWAKGSRQNRLGLPIGLHSGLVWCYYILSVGEQIKYTEKVPSWITGIDGNPIAGILGVAFLSILAILMRNSFHRAKRK